MVEESEKERAEYREKRKTGGRGKCGRRMRDKKKAVIKKTEEGKEVLS